MDEVRAHGSYSGGGGGGGGGADFGSEGTHQALYYGRVARLVSSGVWEVEISEDSSKEIAAAQIYKLHHQPSPKLVAEEGGSGDGGGGGGNGDRVGGANGSGAANDGSEGAAGSDWVLIARQVVRPRGGGDGNEAPPEWCPETKHV